MANEVEIVIKSDDKASAGLDRVKDKGNKLKDGLVTAGKVGGAALAAGVVAGAAVVVDQVGKSIDAASDLNESLNAVSQVFDDQAGRIKDWGANNAAQFGLSQRAFNELATPLGAGLKNAGFALQDTADWTIDLTERASDMASVFNTDVSEAMEAIQSGLRGESDPLEKFGVGLSDARVKARALADTGKDNVKELSNQEIMTARLNEIMDQTNDTAGDFKNTSDGLANSERITAAKVEDLQAKIGQKMLPMVKKWNDAKLALVSTISDKLLPVMDNALPKFQNFAATLGDKLAPKVNELKDAFMGKFREGIVRIKDAFADNKPEIEWLAENLGNLAKRVWPMLTEAARIYATYITGVVEVVIRSIGAMVNAYLTMKENVSGALAGGLEAFKAFGNGVFDMVMSMIKGSLLPLAQAMDAVTGTHTADGVNNALGSLEKWRQGMNQKLDNMIGTLHRYQAEARSDRNEIRIKDQIRTHQARVESLKKSLRDPSLTKERRIQIKADLAREQQKIRDLQRQIDRMHGKTIYINVRERLGAGARKLGRQDYAHGGLVGAQGGGPRSNRTLVGEYGMEIADLPPGTRIRSNADTRRIMDAESRGGSMHILLEIPGIGMIDIDTLNKTIQTNRGIRASIKRAATA